MDWVHAVEKGIQVVQALAEVFDRVEILEHVNDRFKLRVLRQDKSIGFLFGMIEENKQKWGIQEYSCS
jgi:hypothetical protein